MGNTGYPVTGGPPRHDTIGRLRIIIILPSWRWLVEFIIGTRVTKRVRSIFFKPGECLTPGIIRSKLRLLDGVYCPANVGKEDKEKDNYNP